MPGAVRKIVGSMCLDRTWSVRTRPLLDGGMTHAKSEHTFTGMRLCILFHVYLLIRLFLRKCRVAGGRIHSEEENWGMRSSVLERLTLYTNLYCWNFFKQPGSLTLSNHINDLEQCSVYSKPLISVT